MQPGPNAPALCSGRSGMWRGARAATAALTMFGRAAPRAEIFPRLVPANTEDLATRPVDLMPAGAKPAGIGNWRLCCARLQAGLPLGHHAEEHGDRKQRIGTASQSAQPGD